MVDQLANVASQLGGCSMTFVEVLCVLKGKAGKAVFAV